MMAPDIVHVTFTIQGHVVKQMHFGQNQPPQFLLVARFPRRSIPHMTPLHS